MTASAQPITCRPVNAISEVADFLADPVDAADFPETRLRWRNDRASAEIGLETLDNSEWIARFGRFAPFEGSLPQPLALRYHGHQFRVYNPEIGDGRGFLFAQFIDGAGRLMDLATKGSGQTPYSRFGDGRLTLKGAVREILATEMLEALGVQTSRTLSVIETGEELHRADEPSPTRSAVLVRFSHGHIRIGSFQRLATLGDKPGLERLTSYCLRHYYGDESGEDEGAAVRLLDNVVRSTARLAASYMAAGFVHGVLNSDNINITGESFDYGPWRWTPSFDPRFTAAYFDESGLYAFGRQAEAIHWDVAQLAGSLAPLADEDLLIEALNRFAGHYREAIVDRMLWRLGVQPLGMDQDQQLVAALEQGLFESKASVDAFFFDWAGGALRNQDREETYTDQCFAPFISAVSEYQPTRPFGHPYWSGRAPCSMLIEEVEAIWAPIAENDDWSVFENKIQSIRAMGAAMK